MSEDRFDPITWEPSKAFLRWSVWAVLIGSGLFLLVLLLFVPEHRSRIYGPLLTMALATIVGWLLYRGKTSAAVKCLVYGGWGVVTLIAVLYDGVRAPVYYVYPLLIMFVGWLFSTRAALWVAGLTSLTTIGFVVANAFGWLHTGLAPATLAPPVLHGVVMIVVFILSGILVRSLVNTYKDHLTVLHVVSQDAAHHAAELELVKRDLVHAQAVAKVGSWTYDIVDDSMHLSNETCRIFGLPDSTRGNEKSYLDRTDPRDRAMVALAWSAALQGNVFDIEHRINIRERVAWIRHSAEILCDANGKPVKAVGISQDITEQKLAEISLRQSESKFSNAFNSCPLAASISTVAEGCHVEANDNYARDFGWPRAELIGKTATACSLWPHEASRLQWVQQVQAHVNLVDHETVWVHRNGESRNVSISARIIEHDGVACILAYITDITSRKHAEDQIQSLAFFDPLTALPNRRLLIDRLELALTSTMRHHRKGELLFIDLDHFKVLNDTHGHDKGDLLLQQVAQRLKACVREGDTVSRHGGDEFIVMLEDLDLGLHEAANQADQVAQKILENLAQDYHIGELRFRSTPSIGVTLFGEYAEKREEPLRRADIAMYQAKAAGRNSVQFFDPKMQATVAARIALERELCGRRSQYA